MMNHKDHEYVYYCPWRDKIYIVDQYTHCLNMCISAEVFENENGDLFFIQEFYWEYLGKL